MMRIQLSSGYGPAECELAVGKLLAALQKEFPSLAVLETVRGLTFSPLHWSPR